MATRKRWLRFSVAWLMVLVAVLGLATMLVTPLYRWGRPPCLSAARTARWLASRPGSASCVDCHPRGWVDWAQALPPAKPSSQACSWQTPFDRASQAPCISCHRSDR